MNHTHNFQNLTVCLVVRISDVAMQLIAKHDTQIFACFIWPITLVRLVPTIRYYFCINEWNSMTKFLFKNCNVNPDNTPEMRYNKQCQLDVHLCTVYLCRSHQQAAIQWLQRIVWWESNSKKIIFWQPGSSSTTSLRNENFPHNKMAIKTITNIIEA